MSSPVRTANIAADLSHCVRKGIAAPSSAGGRSLSLVAVAWLFVTGGCAARAPGDFYSTVGIDLAAYANGALIRSERREGAPDDAAAFRVLYRSEGLHGEPIAVSGIVIVPWEPAPPGAARPIVAWAHPTTGVVPVCAPSLARVFFDSVQGLREMLQRGFVVTATDYPGLGTAGPHPYLIGISEGRAVLDSVRAARQVPGVGSGRDFAVWGHSQGGQAALFTGMLAASYAPDLHLVGVAAAAPATELATLLADDIGTTGGNNLTAMTMCSWSRVFGAPMEKVVTPAAIPVIDKLAGECIERIFDILLRRGASRALAESFLRPGDFAATSPWRELLVTNTPGSLPPTLPVFLAQGDSDNLVRPPITRAYAASLCKAGSTVQLEILPGVGHAFVARDTAPAAVAWMAARFAGAAAPSTCNAQ